MITVSDPLLTLRAILIISAVGASSGVIYDIFRLAVDMISERGRISKILSVIFDIAFMMICGIALILSLYYLNSGEFRLVFVISFLFGYAVYKITISRAVIKVLSVLAMVVSKMIYILLTPLRLISVWCEKIFRSLALSVEKIKIKLYNNHKTAKNKNAASVAGRCGKRKNDD